MKKMSAGKILELFLLDTFKTAFQMRNLTHRCTESGSFFKNQSIFFNLQKRAGETSPSPSPATWAPVKK